LEDSGLTVAKVALGSIYLAVQNILSMLIGVLGYAFLARIITQEEMGMVAGLTLLTTLVQLLSDFGLNSQ
jgi:O-antigen/teichoic acid export membrane protein